ncbi:MAG: ABC transporter permease [Cryobacterium sp.]|nr:ABC transporter permease [Oligoflexia bacterium]
MIELSNITKSYRMGDQVVTALKGVSLKIEDGDFVAIMGPSGSGKSTLAHILGLLDVPTEGAYRLNGREVSGLSEDELAVLRREEIGFIFQQFNLLPRINALENVALPLLYSAPESDQSYSMKLLERVGLGPRSHHRPNELSGGQQQRVAIARALVNRPRMILADEPTGNLDSKSEKEILGILEELNQSGITIIVVTHEEEVGASAKRLIRMRDGVVQSDVRQSPLSSDPRETKPPLSPPRFRFRDVIEHLSQGYRTLAGNKIRTALSMLGILIGVAAVIAMLALGNGAQKAIADQLSSLGSNLITLRAGAMRIGGVFQEAGATTRITLEDVAAINAQIPSVKEASGSVTGRAQVTFKNKNWSTGVQGAAPPYARIHAAVPEQGRFFNDDETRARARVAVIGMTVVRQLFGESNPIGEQIKINKVAFQIIGVLPEKGSTGWRDQDDILIIPITTAMHRLLGKLYVDSVDIEAKSAELTNTVQDSVRELMESRKRIPESMKGEAFDIRNMADIQAALTESSKTMSALLASIAAISLLVGGIGIMNIMLVSVTERTKEIGLRKAIGARRFDILMQFLAESVVVSGIGGIAGIILGWLITLALSSLTGWNTTISPESVFLAFFFSAFIGMLFGIYPARKASLLHPIDALRYE